MQLIKTVIKDSLLVSVILAVYHPFRLNGDTRSLLLSFLGILIINFVISLMSAYTVNIWIGIGETTNAKNETKMLLLQFLINIPILAVVIGSNLGWQLSGNPLTIWYLGDHYSLWPLASLIPGVAIV